MNRLSALFGVLPRGLRDWKLWLLQAVVNPILFALFVGWLLIPESRGWHLGASLLGIVILAATALLAHAGTLAYFAVGEEAAPAVLRAAYRRALQNLAAFALCAAIIYLLWRSTDGLDAYQSALPTYVRSMPAMMWRHFSREDVCGAYAALLFLVRWIIWPGLLLPFAAAVALSGFRGFGQGRIAMWRAIRSGWYWLNIAIAAVAGVLLSSSLLDWRPFARGASINAESASMAIRLFAAYLTAMTSWLVTCSMVGKKLQAALGARGQTAR
jgi:hypothetical protein